MEELRKEVNAIYQLISVVPVSGDAVDAIAAARAKLKKVYSELEKMGEVKGDGQ